jgi:hypothetical protein
VSFGEGVIHSPQNPLIMQNNSKNHIQINIKKHPTHHLTDEEHENPYLVFEKLYDTISLTDFRELIWKTFLITITGSYPGESTPKEREDAVFVYEQIKKLIDAAHVINEHVKLRGRYSRFEPEKEEEQEDFLEEFSEAFQSANQFDL